LIYLGYLDLNDKIEVLALYKDPAALAKAFEKADCNLSATACYRALLLDFLTQGCGKAFGHGARYYKKPEALAESTRRPPSSSLRLDFPG